MPSNVLYPPEHDELFDARADVAADELRAMRVESTRASAYDDVDREHYVDGAGDA